MSFIGFLILLLVGAGVGWLASIFMRTDAEQGALLNIIVGIIGALIGGLLFGRDIIDNPLSLTAILSSLVGAVILLAIVNLLRRGSVR